MRYKPMNPHDIYELCCNTLDVKPYAITSQRRSENLPKKRLVIAMILLEFTNLSYGQISMMMKRDRTVIYHYRKTFMKKSFGDIDSDLLEQYKKMKSYLTEEEKKYE